jgi:hypothetical protein
MLKNRALIDKLLAFEKSRSSRTLLFVVFGAFLVAVLCLGLWRFHVGLLLGWHPRGSADLHERFVEYGYFLSGVYPSPGVAGDHALPGMRNSVYPPYAFPMLSLFLGLEIGFRAKWLLRSRSQFLFCSWAGLVFAGLWVMGFRRR